MTLVAPTPLWKAAASLHLLTTLTTCYQHLNLNQNRISHPWATSRLRRQHSNSIFGISSIRFMMLSSSSNNNNNNEEVESSSSSSSVWLATPLATSEDIVLAKSLSIWPLDEFNVQLLNEVHPKNFVNPSTTNTTATSATTASSPETATSSSSPTQNEATMQPQQPNHQHYDLVVIGAGAGGLVSSRQASRRGAKSCMISSELAGGDCLNSGCVPSKALLRCAKLIREVRKVATERDNEFGISFTSATTSTSSPAEEVNDVKLSINFSQIMRRMRKLRSQIAPIDGHSRGLSIGTSIYQGRGIFTSPTTIEVIPHGKSIGDVSNPRLSFRKAVIATGGRPYIPSKDNIPGLKDAPYTTNLNLFNLVTLPPRMVIIGSGIVALEMAHAFATFGSKVTVLSRSERILSPSSRGGGGGEGREGDGTEEAAQVLQCALEKEGVTFLKNVVVKEVRTLRGAPDDATIVASMGGYNDEGGEDDNLHQSNLLPLMQLSLTCNDNTIDGVTIDEVTRREIVLECECLLLAMGRVANVQNMGLENGNVQYHPTDGILVNDYAQSISNPNVYAVGDCVAHVPRLTHMSGEMAKVVVQNSLFNGKWKLSSLVVPAVMYTDPEYAVVRANALSLDEHGHVVRSPRTNKDVDGEDAGGGEGEGEILFDTYKAELKHNDRAILDGSDDDGFVIIKCQLGTGKIVSATIVSTRAGEMINEVSLAIKHGIDLEGIGRNIHSYPTLGESVMSCGIQYINSKWETM